jgi:methyl-accepting chemotaxis protein
MAGVMMTEAAAPKAEAPRREPAKPSIEAAKPKLTPRKAPLLRKSAEKQATAKKFKRLHRK